MKEIKTWILVLVCFANLCLAAEPTLEELFSQALHEKGETYLRARCLILSSGTGHSFLKERSQGTDFQTRLLSQALLGRIKATERYQHYEELMIVPIIQAVKYRAMSIIGAKPFETIKSIAQQPSTWNGVVGMGGRTVKPESSKSTYKSYCHDDSAFVFLAEMALKNTMLDFPELSEQIEWLNKEQTYTVEEAAGMLGVSRLTVDKWHKAGLFSRPRANSADLFAPIKQAQIQTFYKFYSDKIINPEYLGSRVPVSRVVHSDMQGVSQRFQQDPGSLFRSYAVLMIGTFSKPEAGEVLYEVFKTDASDYVRAYCVEGFSAKRQVDQIRLAMKDTSWLVRKAAVVKSKENLDAFDVSEYIQLINGKDRSRDNINQEIAQALGKKGDIAAIDPLIEMLGYDYPEKAIAKALLAIDPNSMYKILEHKNQTIRREAWRALNYSDIDFFLKRDYFVNYFSHFIDDTHSIELAMRIISRSDPEFLVDFFEDENPFMRKTAIDLLDDRRTYYRGTKEKHELVAFFEFCKDSFLSCIGDPDAGVRRSALWALRRYHSKGIPKVFLESLNDPDSGCRQTALDNLRGHQILSVSVLDDLLMRETVPEVRIAAFRALSKSPDTSRKGILIKHVGDKNPTVREIIADALGQFKDEETVETLKALLNDTRVRHQAMESIIRIDVELLSEILPKVDPELRHVAYHYLRKIKSDAAINWLIKGSRDDDVDVRFTAIMSLSERKYSYELGHRAVFAVQERLQDDNPKIRSLAIYRLYKMIGDKSLVDIAACLDDPEKDVRRSAVWTLSKFKKGNVVKYLLNALSKEEDKGMLVAIVTALKEITGNLLTKDEWMLWRKENEVIENREGI